MILADWMTGFGEAFALVFGSVLVKGTLVLGLGWLVIRLLSGIQASTRHAILQALLLALAALPFLAVVVPAWHLGAVDQLAQPLDLGSVASPQSVAVSSGAPEASPLALSGLAVFAFWSVGAAVALGRMLSRLAATRRVVHQADLVRDDQVITTVARCVSESGRRGPTVLRITKETAVPFVWGWRRPTVVLPGEAAAWSAEQLRAVVHHELAHIRRCDNLLFGLAVLVQVLYWFHPLVRLAVHRLRLECERAADDIVLGGGSEPSAYAEHLFEIAKSLYSRKGHLPIGTAMARKSHLEGRIMSILRGGERSTTARPATVILATVLSLALILPLAGLQVSAEDEVAPEKAKKEEMLKKAKAEQATIKVEKAADDEAAPEEAKKAEMLKKAKAEQAAVKVRKKAEAVDYPAPDEHVKVDVHPEMLKKKEPWYPDEAKAAKMQGDVWVQALVDRDGSVVKARVSKSSGHKLLDKSAVKAAYGCEYKPAMQGQKPVATWVTYKISFNLDDCDVADDQG